MTNLIATFRIVLVIGWQLYLNICSCHFDLVAGHLYSDSLAVYLRYHEKLADWSYRLQGFSRLSRLWSCWDSLSLDGNWNLASFDSSSDLCDLSDFTKYHYWTSRELIRVYKRLGLPLEWLGGSDSKKFEIPLAMPVMMSGIRTAAVLDYRYGNLSCLDWCRGLGSFILWELTVIMPVWFWLGPFLLQCLPLPLTSY